MTAERLEEIKEIRNNPHLLDRTRSAFDDLITTVADLTKRLKAVETPEILDSDAWGVTATMLNWMEKIERRSNDTLVCRAALAFANDVHRLRGHIAIILNAKKDAESNLAFCKAALDAHREAVRVLANECDTWRTHTEENYYTNAMRACRKTDANPLAAAAVREAKEQA